MHVTSVVRLRITPYTVPNGSIIDKWLNDDSQLTPFLHHSILPLWWTIYRWHTSTLQRAHILIAVISSRNHPNCFTIMLLHISIYIPRNFQCSNHLALYTTAHTSTWAPQIIGLWLGNIQYGMQQLQLYSSGQLILKHISLPVPSRKFSMHSSIQHQHICSISNLMKYYSVASWPC